MSVTSRNQVRSQWGVTPPISMQAPTQNELQLDEALLLELKKQNSFESPEESQNRQRVLLELQQMVEEFVTRVGIQKHLDKAMAKDAGAKIFTFGSYRLGVHGPGSDIDTLVVVPKHVSREDLFKTFEPMLRHKKEVTDLTPVPEAYVPIKKNMDLMDNNLLKNISDQCIKSLNGTRVTDQILQLVPNSSVFKQALRCIKLWAQKRAIYANIFGFPGGVAWAMLVARICQLYPRAVSATIISKFFKILSQWNWPQPIMLKHIEDGPLNVKVWNPKIYPSDRAHRMPIITPAYPSMCATHTVTSSTQTIILREMEHAASIMDDIFAEKAQWSDLFKPHTFFNTYKNYICILAASRDPNSQLKWAGLVESKVRHLVSKLEVLENVELAHPFVKRFERKYTCNSDDQVMKVAAGADDGVPSEPMDIEKDLKSLAQTDYEFTLWTAMWFIGLEIFTGEGSPKRLDISWPTQEFYDVCRKWDQYDSKTTSICLKVVKCYDLPDFVFEDPRLKAKRPVKRIKKREAQSMESKSDGEEVRKKHKVLEKAETTTKDSSIVPAA